MDLNDKLKEVIEKGKVIEVIDYNPDRCVITLLGDYEGDKYVMRLSKKEYPQDITSSVINGIKNLKTIFNNDIYYKFIADDFISNKCKADFIYPADTKVIDKYRKHDLILYRETYDSYLLKTKPYIDSIPQSHIQWIENVLYNNAEKELLKTNEFMIFLDYKSVGDEKKLNCLGIPYNDKIKSLRDINGDHLGLLENFYNAV
jgi:m7GpppX diphosphatase